jgi:hypothetical protein
MGLSTEFDSAFAGLLAAWRKHNSLKIAGADISTLAEASAELDHARAGVISARTSMIV